MMQNEKIPQKEIYFHSVAQMRQNTTEDKSILRRLNRLALLLNCFIRQSWAIPSIIVAALRQRRRQAALDAAEAERLDRIRNPSDYLGR